MDLPGKSIQIGVVSFFGHNKNTLETERAMNNYLLLNYIILMKLISLNIREFQCPVRFVHQIGLFHYLLLLDDRLFSSNRFSNNHSSVHARADLLI